MPEKLIDAEPLDDKGGVASPMGELVVQHLTGLPVIWKPLDKDGNSQFDAHPEGEGYSLADWERDRDSGLYSEKDLEAWRAGCFLRIRCTEAEAAAHWAEVVVPAPDPAEAVKTLLGNTSVKLEAAIAELPLVKDADTTRREVIKAYTVEALDAAAKTYALKGNVVRKEWFAAATAIAIAPEEVAEKSAELDTFRNAVLTVGTGKTYSTIGAAITASSSGDSVEGYDATFSEVVSFGAKAIVLINRRAGAFSSTITASSAGAVVTGHSAPASHSFLVGFKVINTNNAAGGCITNVANSGTYMIVSECWAAGGYQYGIAGTATPLQAYNCIASNIAGTGFGAHGANAWTIPIHCGAFKCARGFSAAAGYVRGSWLLAAGNTTKDFDTGTWSFSVSADATASGAACVTGFDTADFVDYANNDFRIRAAVKATTKARLYGYTNLRGDGWSQTRRRADSCAGFAGAHDPDPGVIPTGPAVDPTLFTAFGLDNELTAAMDVPALSSVLPTDTLRGAAGTSDKTMSDAEAAAWEAARNATDAGASDIMAGKYVKIANVTTNGTGSLAGDPPTAPTWGTIPVTPASGQVTISLVANAPTDTLQVRYKLATASVWATARVADRRTGSGNVVVSGLVDESLYVFTAYNYVGTTESEWLDPRFSTPTAGSNGRYTTFVSELRAQIRDSAALAAKITDGLPANHVTLGRKVWTANTYAAALALGPVVEIYPASQVWSSRTADTANAPIAARVVIHEAIDQSGSSELLAPMNFVDALRQELLAESDGTTASFLSRCTNVRISIEGPMEGRLANEVETHLTITADTAEAI